jgi:hemolysin III
MASSVFVMSAVAERPQTLHEELANSISHGLGFVLAAAAAPVLVDIASRTGRLTDLIAAYVFSATMLLLYFASAAYHALPEGRAKRLFWRLDHAAIFLFIAGSYTPFSLGMLTSSHDWLIFGLIWAVALVGVVLKATDRLTNPWLSLGLYIGLGWCVLIAALPMLERVSAANLQLIIGGGVTYTAGAVFFVLDSRVRYAHFIWHLFVLAGSACHFCAALWHVR